MRLHYKTYACTNPWARTPEYNTNISKYWLFQSADSDATEEKAWTFDLDDYYTPTEKQQYNSGNIFS